MKIRKLLLCLVPIITIIMIACDMGDNKPGQEEAGKRLGVPVSGKDYIYASVSNALHIIDGDTDSVIKTIPHEDYIMGGGFSPDKSRYYMNAFHSIHVVDTATMELIDTYRFSSDLSRVFVAGFTISEDRKTMYLSCTIAKKKQNIPRLNLLPPQLVVFDLDTKKVVKSFDLPYMVKSVMRIKNDPEHLLLCGYEVYKININTGKLVVILNMFTPKGDEYPKNYSALSEGITPGDHGITILQYMTGKGLSTSIGYLFLDRNKGQAWTMPGKDLWLAYTSILSPDKKYIFSVMDELIKIDAETGKTIGFVETETGTNYCIALSSDGKKIYIGPGGPDISVYDAENLSLIKVIPLDADGAILHRLTI